MKCEHCGVVDERGPHTLQNCSGVIKYLAAQLAIGAEVAERRAEALERRAGAAEARVLELERRFHVVPCPLCGSIARRGEPHVHGFVMGSHVKYLSCDGLE